MGHGALDAVDMPPSTAILSERAAPLLAKIATISRLIGEKDASPGSDAMPTTASPTTRWSRSARRRAGRPLLAAVLGGLPKDFPAAIVIVQHVDAQFAAGMAELAEPAVAAAGHASPAREGTPAVGARAARRDERPSDVEVGRSPRLHAGAASTMPTVRRSTCSSTASCRLWQGPAVGVLLTGMGTRRRAGPEGAARQGPSHDRAGPGHQRRVRHAESRRQR